MKKWIIEHGTEYYVCDMRKEAKTELGWSYKFIDRKPYPYEEVQTVTVELNGLKLHYNNEEDWNTICITIENDFVDQEIYLTNDNGEIDIETCLVLKETEFPKKHKLPKD